ncbi:Very-long-chain 3-oxoacyl-CoA synthase protein [Dioscorea alata]|uniref:Very-long-chain 3-oxoacyl-CoA synthase protein n=2 Tax=Dioscorea alata TaxID=55571 RepID=A0ACB7UKI3_DIOAL|nr:Very-long-chain 3-oxoacyl-CoA synthase protein [Dioscorea alata]KAH7660945.1 Very-long-chain 3-oxoacyl-CoA synthase protein [Dioscorea alata]
MASALRYWFAEHPAIVSFRWSHAASFGSTWSFLFSSIAIYLLTSLFLHLTLSLFGRRRPIPLGPLPSLHSLAMVFVSATIFLGLLLSSLAEIRDTRWFWRRSKTPLQWLLCFPLGTRPTGRVFFWSYAFYLSRFLHLLRTFISILRRRRLTFSRLLNHSIHLCMSFLWLEFSQSFQVLAILSSTLAYIVVFGYRFWVGTGSCCFPVVLASQIALLGCNLACHLGVLLLHFWKGGCNGIGAWVFNSVLNAALLLVFLNCYVRRIMAKGKRFSLDEDCPSLHCRPSSELLQPPPSPPPPLKKDQ